MAISQIFAVSSNHVLGKDNGLAWHLPKDMKFFKTKTSGQIVVMGRKTFESLGKALPHRTNMVITRNKNFKAENCEVVNTLEEALANANKKEGEIFIIGGAQIFESSAGLTDKIFLTEVHAEVQGDIYYDFDKTLWKEVNRELHLKDDKHAYDFSFVELERKWL